MLAVIMAVTKFNLFVGGRPFKVLIDHRNLQYWQTASASPKVERWRQLLSTYDITYEFLPGTKNVVADAMSRLFLDSDIADVTAPLITPQATLAGIKTGTKVPPSGKHVSFSDKHPVDMSLFHGNLAGHFKVDKTMQKIKRAGINYRGLHKEVEAFIASCPVCQRQSYKPPIKGHTYSLESSRPDEMISMDTMGPIDEDRFGFKYVLVMIDSMTKFTRLFPMRSDGAEDCASNLLSYICKDGKPENIRSDNGTEFVNDVIEQLLIFAQISHIKSTPDSHEENGLVERVIKDVRRQLQAYILERGEVKDWSLILPMVERLINTKINVRTGLTPAALKFGNPTALEIHPFNVTPDSARPVFKNASEYLESISRFQAALIHSHTASMDEVHA